VIIKKPNNNRIKGFTLMEIMVSTAILVVILGLVSLVFRNALRSWLSSQIQSNRYQSIRYFLKTFSDDSSSFFTSDSIPLTFQAEKNKFFFLNRGLEEGKLGEVGYFFDEDNSRIMRSFEENSDYDFDTFDTQTDLVRGVTDFSLSYYDGDQWLDQLGEEDSFAEKVKVEFTVTFESDATEDFSSVVYIPMSR